MRHSSIRLAASAVALAALPISPAAAQFWDGGGNAQTRGPSVTFRVDSERESLDRTIREARDAGQLTRKEARQLRRENHQIGSLAARYGQDGLSQSEQKELDFRSQALSGFVNARRTQDVIGR